MKAGKRFSVMIGCFVCFELCSQQSLRMNCDSTDRYKGLSFEKSANTYHGLTAGISHVNRKGDTLEMTYELYSKEGCCWVNREGCGLARICFRNDNGVLLKSDDERVFQIPDGFPLLPRSFIKESIVVIPPKEAHTVEIYFGFSPLGTKPLIISPQGGVK
jgi:hypothetical protein